MDACFSDETIARLREGRLSDAELAALRRHAVRCTSCLALLAVHPLGAEDEAAELDSLLASPAGAGAGAASWPPVRIGDIVAGHRIVQALGAGGMGAVFEARNESIERRVAIKILRPLRDDGDDGARLLTEARAANVVEHPGIVRVHEVGQLLGGEPFLVMEHLEGETLEGRLARGGGPEVLPLLAQLAAALAAAHEKGVIHRDLKPDNVMIVPDPLVPGGERVKVLDFGLAKVGLDAAAPGQTRSGVMMGTPRYMSPEQCRSAGKVDGRADVYSLGIILYRALAGRVPFEGQDLGELLAAHLRDAPPPLQAAAPEAPLALVRLTEQMLAKDPAQRPSMAEVAEALSAGLAHPPPAAHAMPRGGSWRRRRFIAWATLSAGGLLGLGGVRLLRDGLPPAAKASGRRSVAVLGFKSLSGQPEVAWISAALGELLGAELAAGEELRLVSSESVAQMQAELQLAAAESYGPEVRARIRKNLGADLLVMGSYLALGDRERGQLRIIVRLQEARGGETVAQASETGTQGELLDLVARTGAALRGRLGLGGLSAAAAGGLAASRPGSPEAIRLYAQGLERLRRFDALGARELLEEAARADGGFPLVHSALADAWAQLGYEDRAREAAKRAFERAGALPEGERMAVEARHLTSAGQAGRAVEIYRALMRLHPDDIEHGLALVRALIAADDVRGALGAAQALRRLPAPEGDDPRVDLAEGNAAYLISDFSTAETALGRAVTKGTARGARLLVARAMRLQAWVAFNRGDHARALRLGREARRLFAAVGDRSGEASSLEPITGAELWTGDVPAGLISIQESLRLYREVGNLSEVSIQTVNVGNALCQAGRLREAREHGEEGLEVGRRVGRKEAIGNAQAVLGWIATLEGRMGEADRLVKEARRAFTELGDPMLTAWTLFLEGEIRLQEGRLAEARELHEKGLGLRRDKGLQDYAAESQVALAALHIEDSRPAEGESLARAARERFVTSGGAANRGWAEAVLARALLAQGRRTEALRALPAEPERIRHVPIRLTAVAIAGRVRAAAEPAQETAARRLLGEALEEAKRGGLRGAELELRLALGELDQAAAAPGAAARLAALSTEAVGAGFALLARRAAAAR